MRTTVAELRAVDLFDDSSDEDVAAWAAAAQTHVFADGEVLNEQATPVSDLFLMLEGRAATLVHDQDGREERFGTQVAPTWSGAIGVLLEESSGATVRAEGEVRAAVVPGEAARALMLAQQPILMRVVRQLRPLSRRIAQRETDRERLESLGTMSAGLAHELNNPAAAARRAAASLGEAITEVSSTLASFVEAGVPLDSARELVALHAEAVEAAARRGPLDALDAADAEDDLLDALQDAGVGEAWQVVEPLAAAGVDAAWLQRARAAAGDATPAAVRWTAATLTAAGLVGELQDSTKRMSELVSAIKAYSYMDRGELNEVDLHEGLETTLVVLGHKLKHTEIDVERHYDRELPKLTVHGPELNQVWTNLLDNAIDALGEHGTVSISTRRDGDCVEVEIADDGPGIPEAVRERIFDPFFTTKAVGAGTGLGLDSVRRIVSERHRGSVRAEPREDGAAGTRFTVRLPLHDTAR